MLENIIVQLVLLSMLVTILNYFLLRKVRRLYKAPIYVIEAILVVCAASFIQCNIIRESCAIDALAWVARGIFFFIALLSITILTYLTSQIAKK